MILKLDAQQLLTQGRNPISGYLGATIHRHHTTRDQLIHFVLQQYPEHISLFLSQWARNPFFDGGRKGRRPRSGPMTLSGSRTAIISTSTPYGNILKHDSLPSPLNPLHFWQTYLWPLLPSHFKHVASVEATPEPSWEFFRPMTMTKEWPIHINHGQIRWQNTSTLPGF